MMKNSLAILLFAKAKYVMTLLSKIILLSSFCLLHDSNCFPLFMFHDVYNINIVLYYLGVYQENFLTNETVHHKT